MAAGGVADGDQRWLVECLTATLDTARDVRAFAEESLRQASLLPGTLPPPTPFPLSVAMGAQFKYGRRSSIGQFSITRWLGAAFG